ncbi:LytTR family DNA-binding domain-containing protein [Allomuricauda sp. SCSIO 65647]|uniref:LytR/AlgR family response regulator transcription factor n=1 Tax=Allomuricauda sp. SCSIO 65647 TaxID=2908843 RepID=UPI001F373DD6|nr:LytTR family DNA-binding domain-containing protein [Muricauda sp. SCSIO 65647]UJH67805.1 LytTR family DNA-binding domain-containing protein [Muricauda sp. SCSIO 65647]
MNCLIVDDEPIAIKVIESHLREFKDLKLVAKCRSAMQAFEILEKEQVDIIFLDIEMPKLDGFSFLKSLKNPPMVVVTTAHRDFALEGFELDVVDYLLKPISLERMMQAIMKAKRSLNEKESPSDVSQFVQPEFSSYIFVRSERENVKVELQSILYVESLKNHVKIVTLNDTYITLVSIGKMEDKLPRDIFIRAHRSYLVNLHRIENYSNTYIVIKRKSIPLGNMYKEKVLEFLERKQI